MAKIYAYEAALRRGYLHIIPGDMRNLITAHITERVYTAGRHFTICSTLVFGLLHTFNDVPACVSRGRAGAGNIYSYYKYGVLHRDAGPAYIDGGSGDWYTHGLKYRNGQTQYRVNGEQYWYDNY